jgi:hypothetical protein
MKLRELSRVLAGFGVAHTIVHGDPWEAAMHAAHEIATGKDASVVLAGLFSATASDMKKFKHTDFYWSRLLKDNNVKCDDPILLQLVQDLYLQHVNKTPGSSRPDTADEERDFVGVFVIDNINRIRTLCHSYKAAAKENN